MFNKSQLSITQAKLFAYQLPLQTPMRFKTAHLNHREGLILQLQDSNNDQYYSEIAPLPGFSQERLSQVKTEIIQLLSTNLTQVTSYKSGFKSVQFALDCFFPYCPKQEQQQLNNMENVPLLQGDCKAITQQYQSLAYPNLIKLKVARNTVDSDILVFQQLCQLNPLIKIRCDANQAWNKQQANLFFSAIETQKLDYIEEPTCDHQVNLQLAEKYQIYLGLDETLQQTDFHYWHHPFIKAFIIKPSLVGSKQVIDQYITLAKQHHILVSFSSSFESVVGLQQLKNLANHYLGQPDSQSLVISLGIDTLKYFKGNLLKNEDKIQQDCKQLELLWIGNR
ncbi:o-succinylbenzoate synthase [Psychromonas sp. KJ10-10]|uniref:o-succinylbenzoate synthase n=1 Tax=Psychromonas sp. KJ10-10 TaxID=3391823 RepID=UPI0039B3E336